MSDNKIKNRDNWVFADDVEDFTYESIRNYYRAYMYERTLKMFEYKNLPDGIIYRDIEKFTQPKGKTFFLYSKEYGRYYALTGAFKDFITWNKEPKQALIVNPALPLLKQEWELGKDCVVIGNDDYYIGLSGIIEKYSHLLAQADLSFNYSLFNLRLKSVFGANDSNTKTSLDGLFEDVWNGKIIHAIATEDLTNSLKDVSALDFNKTTNNELQMLVEARQYLIASFFIDLGINANYNMKRESISQEEFRMNDDAMIPLIDNMLEARKRAVDEINKLFGLDIEVDFSSAWKKFREEIQIAKDKELQELKTIEIQNENLENNVDEIEEPKEENKDGDSDV